MLLSTLKVSSNGNMISVRSFTFLQDFFFSFFINILFQVLLLYFILRVGIAIIFANFYLCQIYFLFFKFFFFLTCLKVDIVFSFHWGSLSTFAGKFLSWGMTFLKKIHLLQPSKVMIHKPLYAFTATVAIKKSLTFIPFK